MRGCFRPRQRKPSLTARLVAQLARATFALEAVIATEPDAGLADYQEAERQRQREERAPKREAMIPAMRRVVTEGNELLAEGQRRGLAAPPPKGATS